MVHSTKHYVQNSLETVAGGAQAIKSLVVAVPVVDKNAVFEVEEGNSVKAIYIEQWILSLEAALGTFIAVVYKLPGGGVAFTTAQMAALGNQENKKNILYCTQGIFNQTVSVATPLLRNWIKIPKSKQRMGLGDQIIFQIFAQATIDLGLCGFVTYKEYS